LAIVTERWDGIAVDAAVSGVKCVRRAVFRERTARAGRTMLKRTVKSCGPDAQWLASSLTEVRKPNRARVASFREATEARKPILRESAK